MYRNGSVACVSFAVVVDPIGQQLPTRRGTLERGKTADLCVVSEDPFAIPAERLREVRPVMTIFGGEVVWRDF